MKTPSLRLTDHKIPTACGLGIVAVSINVIVPFATQPFPAESFELAWWHPGKGNAAHVYTQFHRWELGESIKMVNIPKPPKEWTDYEGIVLIYASRSNSEVTLETAFSYRQRPMQFIDRKDGEIVNDAFAVGVEWERPWSSGIVVNGAIPPYNVKLTRLSR